ncbi:MAG: DUF4340 domain-containing protein [Kiritimatiellae bacterium]|nr:DUF4340 domain-containing protein [Kiritimatiellia bacterium]MDD5520101.1 DUF4340 domain-containing protein [Kiritimatiellia bacterium]
MKGKNLLILIVLAIVLAALAVKKEKVNTKSPPDVIGKQVFPDLAVDQVEKITVYSGEGTATVVRADDIWTVPDRYNYPADFSKVKDYLMKFSDMKIGQVMKLDDKQKTAMRILSPGAGTSNITKPVGTMVELGGKGNAILASLLIGEARMKKPGSDMPDYGGYPDGQYISSDGGKNVYLVNTALNELPANTKNWLDQEILNVMSSDIREISITGPGRKDTKLAKKKDSTSLEVEGLATNEVTAASKMYSIESALTYFKLDDIADPSTKIEQSGLDKPVLFKAVTQKGEIFTVKIGKKKESTDLLYCKVEAALKDTGKQPEPKDENEKKKAEQATKERKELEDKIKSLNEKLSKWIYLVASQKIDTMTPKRETLIEKKEEKKKEENKTTSEASPVNTSTQK